MKDRAAVLREHVERAAVHLAAARGVAAGDPCRAAAMLTYQDFDAGYHSVRKLLDKVPADTRY